MNKKTCNWIIKDFEITNLIKKIYENNKQGKEILNNNEK